MECDWVCKDLVCIIYGVCLCVCPLMDGLEFGVWFLGLERPRECVVKLGFCFGGGRRMVRINDHWYNIGLCMKPVAKCSSSVPMCLIVL